MGKRGVQSRSAVDQLQLVLTRSLKESVTDTVKSVCTSFQQVVEAQTKSTKEGVGYDQFYTACRRLVDYIAQYMETSPGFENQMDRIILACHSRATGRVLDTVVRDELWFRRRGAPSRSSRSTGRMARKTKVKQESAIKETERAEVPAMQSKGTPGRKRGTRSSARDPQPVKRQRRAARPVIIESSEEGEEEEEGDEEKKGRRKSVQAAKRRNLEKADDEALLPFKDAIGELCYPDGRTLSDTKFFKKRLCKSIQFVDALLCNPPPGKVCGRACKKIRLQMCSSSVPCQNKMCRIWHDVEAHTDRCQNAYCEFKNRILLRETMHKIEMKEQQMAVTMVELNHKQAELEYAAEKDRMAIENDLAQLSLDLEECERELGVLQATERAFYSILNKVGIAGSDDVIDDFPDFATHYVEKTAPRKVRKAMAASTSPLTSASSRSSRRVSAKSHGKSGDDNAGSERAKRRSTSSGRRSPSLQRKCVEGGEKESEIGNEQTNSFMPDEPPLPSAGPPPIRQNPELDQAYFISASGYSVHPLADDLDAPAVAPSIESAKVTDLPSERGLTNEQLTDTQRASEDNSGMIAGMSTALPLVEASNTTALIVSDVQSRDL